MTPELLNKVENVMHSAECNADHMLQYLVVNFAKSFRSQTSQTKHQTNETNETNETNGPSFKKELIPIQLKETDLQ